MADDAPRRLERDLHDQDPSALTSAQLFREMANLELRLNDKIEAIRDSAKLIHTDYTRVPTLLDRAVTELRALLEQRIELEQKLTIERFAKVETQFTELNLRTSQLKTASDTAIAAAMAAAEKAVGENNRSFSLAVAKSETMTSEALKNLGENLKTEVRATNDKVGTLADRMNRSEGSNSAMWAMGAAIIAVVSLLLAGYSAFHGSNVAVPVPTVQYVPAPPAVPAPVTVPR